MFNEGWWFLISMASEIFLFTLLLLYPFRSILKSFGDTDGWPDWRVCLSMCDLLSLPACSIILPFSLLAVSPKHVSEHVFSGHLSMSGRVYVPVLFGLLCQMQSPIFYFYIRVVLYDFVVITDVIVNWLNNFLSLFTIIGKD